MKMNLKKMMDEADDSILDELISACESKMAGKFKKEEPKEESAVIIAAEGPKEDMEDDDLDEESMKKLLEKYKTMKG
jgi:hypothetical protein